MANGARADVIIIGAGVIGCACAFELATAGARVSVFDARRIGQGASQASAGVLAPYIEGHESSPLRELGRRSLDLYDNFIARLLEASGLPVQYTRGGTLELALEADHAAHLQQSQDALQRQGLAARWLDERDLQEAEPLATRGALGGLLIEMHGFVGVPDLTHALSACAMRAGATFAPESRVVAVGPSGDGRVDVHTENGVTTADRVELAAGSWTGQVRLAGLAGPVVIRAGRSEPLDRSS